MSDDEPLNRKNITAELIGGDFIDLDGIEPPDGLQQPAADGNPPEPEPEEFNALIDVIDVGLDFADDFLKDAGYPSTKRKIWEERGKKAMNKALNAYCPAGSAVGGVMDSNITALLIGVGSLLICLYPVIAHFMKQRNAAKQAEQTPEPEAETSTSNAPQYVEKYEKPETRVSSTAPISNMDVKPIERIQQREQTGMLPGF